MSEETTFDILFRPPSIKYICIYVCSFSVKYDLVKIECRILIEPYRFNSYVVIHGRPLMLINDVESELMELIREMMERSRINEKIDR